MLRVLNVYLRHGGGLAGRRDKSGCGYRICAKPRAEHAELHLLLSMITPLSWLERVPSYKDQQQKLSDRDLATYGFLGYPLLQAADINLSRRMGACWR